MSLFAPVQKLADVVAYQWLGLSPGSYLGNGIHFFIYDSIKIGLLLLLVNYVMAATRSLLPMDKVRDLLTKRRWYGMDYLLAALLGVVTPFCSCSSIPLFIGFLSAGIPLGVTFTFLMSSPLVNEASLYLFPAIFGLKTTLVYNFLGIALSILGGIAIQKLRMEKYVRPEFLNLKPKKLPEVEADRKPNSLKVLMNNWWIESLDISKNVFPYVILGVGVGSLIHGIVPESFVRENLAGRDWWVVPMAVLLGAPLYANSIGVIPVAEALIDKGLPLGTILALMTATVTLSIPEGLMLAKVMKKQLLAAFFGVTTVAIIIMGYLFNGDLFR